MTTSRRLFMAQASVVAGVVILKKHFVPVNLAVNPGESTFVSDNTLIIYHTNNLNGRIEPDYQNPGGFDRIGLQLKNEKNPGLLLDAGSFLNTGHSFSQQKNTVALMNAIGYKAAAVGGLDFSGDGERMAALIPQMQFSLVNCNHRFSAGLKSLIKPYRVFKAKGLKIGVTGVCLPLNGAKYIDAIECANRTARFLKEDERCNLVICFSDLGFGNGENELSDQKLAATSEHIDLVIGTDRGKFNNNDRVLRNKLKHEVVFSAAVGKGLTIGKTVIDFNDEKRKHSMIVEHIIPGKPENQSFAVALRELRSIDPSAILS